MNATKRYVLQAALFCLCLLVQGCDRSSEPTAEEKALLITVGEFAPYVKGSHDQSRGRFKKESNPFTDSKELNYTFEFKEEENEPPLYVNCTINLEPKVSSASDRAAREVGIAIGFAIGKLKKVPLEGFPKFGDYSSIYLLTLDDKPVGNLFTAEYGRKSVTLVVSGLYVREPAVWQEMFGKKLRLLEAYEEPKT